ncbi:MAG: hypothetical protein PWQ31_525 [Eubacteriales bacterium]|nr:hypothetical protein [Eubacteriales bacterium]
MEIYLDNTATSFPKAEAVYQAVYDFIRNIGVNAGRGAYRRPLAANKIMKHAGVWQNFSASKRFPG